MGFAAFSTSCMTDQPQGMELFMVYQMKNFNLAHLIIDGPDGSKVSIPCPSFKFPPRYSLLKLQAGQYSIIGFASTTISTNSNFKLIDFTIVPGKVNYLGRLNLAVISPTVKFFSTSPGHLLHVFVDNSARDIPKFLQLYKNIPRDKYIVSIPKREYKNS